MFFFGCSLFPLVSPLSQTKTKLTVEGYQVLLFKLKLFFLVFSRGSLGGASYIFLGILNLKGTLHSILCVSSASKWQLCTQRPLVSIYCLICSIMMKYRKEYIEHGGHEIVSIRSIVTSPTQKWEGGSGENPLNGFPPSILVCSESNRPLIRVTHP